MDGAVKVWPFLSKEMHITLIIHKILGHVDVTEVKVLTRLSEVKYEQI